MEPPHEKRFTLLHARRIRELEAIILEISAEQHKTRKDLTALSAQDEINVRKLKVGDRRLSEDEEEFARKCRWLTEDIEEIEMDKKQYEKTTSIAVSDLENMRAENNRLRECIRKFQEDISEIFFG